MSAASQILTAACALAAVTAAVSLWRGAARSEGRDRSAYRWLAAAALCWGAGLVTRQVWAIAAAASAVPLTFADLPALLALPAIAAGLVMLAPRRFRGPGGLAVQLADGYLLAASAFLIAWVTLLGPDYARSDAGAAAFALQMIHPLVDLLVLGGALPLAVLAGRRGLLPYLALLLVAVSDSLDVSARLASVHAGAATLLLLVVALCLLGAAPAAALGWLALPGGARQLPRLPAIRSLSGLGYGTDAEVQPQPAGDPAEPSKAAAGPALPGDVPAPPVTATVVASLAAVAAVLVLLGWGLSGGAVSVPVVWLAGGTAVLALAVRALALVWQQRMAARGGADAGHRFLELADRTSDLVLVCDLDGVIGYASPAVADYGYTPGSLTGRNLADYLHPEDQSGWSRGARAAAAGQPQAAADRYPCRVRASDGTWRYIQSTVSRQASPGGPVRLLVTARDLSDQVALRRQVAHLTFHDGLTGLPNRAYIEDRARGALGAVPAPRAGEPPARAPAPVAGIIIIDLDGFTAVNDSAGHSAGDLILAQAARRLRSVVPADDTVARWGGDEFAVLIEDAATGREVIEIAERLAASISSDPFRVGDRELSLLASVGVALSDGSPPGYVWRNADVAMTRAKQAGGGQVEVYAAGGQPDDPQRAELARDLQRAIAGGGLSLRYQPVAELAGGRVTGADVVVGWQRSGEQVPAREFLGLAEASGLSVPLGEWVLREACAQAGRWQRAGLAAGIFLRVSPAEVVAPRFEESVLSALAAAGLPASTLILEASERDLVQGTEMLPGLAELRQAGVRLAIADFGTDYASLSYLRRRPVDVMKIDSSFVAGLGTDATLAKLVEAIVRVGSDLGIEVVAAGVEQQAQLDLLRGMGCPLAQGGAVAPVMDASALAAAILPGRNDPAGSPRGGGGQAAGEAAVPDAETKLTTS
jgi:diguanylate cyclase (GGDEF)-like protein/PAS domain S-box-containing protein